MRQGILCLVFAAFAACSSADAPKSRAVPSKEAQTLLIDRNWIDRMPETEKDKLFVYRFVPSMGGGVFQDRTIYKGTFELFMFESTDAEIRFVLPETKEKVTSKFLIENVDGPAPFDLKLTITDDPRGPKIYYGMRSETDREGRLLDQRLRTKIITN
ncbi:MAG: hypothetical protein M4D80_29355 [Myxococcota bacterium]|nr:hypothetical protein [Deltaproteobacteria bacterium]MDQ3339291.1 hypothetical protein [Myxococcota bacterium]